MKRLENINKLKVHPDNPRLIKDYKFDKLVKSLQSFPEMLEKRPLIVNKDLVCLGGNMRLKAAREAGIKKVWIDVADWSEEKQKEFIIKDNSNFGEWDWDVLANEWDNEVLNEFGLDVWTDVESKDLENFFEENENDNKSIFVKTIVLKYKEEEYGPIKQFIDSQDKTPEELFKKILDL